MGVVWYKQAEVDLEAAVLGPQRPLWSTLWVHLFGLTPVGHPCRTLVNQEGLSLLKDTD